ncbi:MAG: hypothetical protein NC325_09050 [Anaeroplasma bactoclasticum]|nr:hypothetical protein [Anaeroplasma bactoclasticum]
MKAYYLNEDYIEGESDPLDKYFYDEESPIFRAFVIDGEEEFNRIFFEI